MLVHCTKQKNIMILTLRQLGIADHCTKQKKCMILTLRQFLILVHCTKLKKSYDINTKIMHTKIIRTLTYLTTSTFFFNFSQLLQRFSKISQLLYSDFCKQTKHASTNRNTGYRQGIFLLVNALFCLFTKVGI